MANKNALLHSKMLLASIAGLVLLFVFGAIARSKVSDRAGAESKTRAALASNPGSPAHADAPARPERNPDREAYFGETHVHTSWSFAAFVFGNHVTGPADSYKYFKGETIKHPLGYDIKIETPLDFAGVTDHSEYVGTVRLSNDPNSPISKLPIASKLVVHDAADIQRIYLWLGTAMIEGKPIKELLVPSIVRTVWDDNNKAADAANRPGKFTAFCSYEWTSTPDFRNMHRNVFFKECRKVPQAPFSSIDSSHPEDLWKWMEAQRKAGNELLAISHNANLSACIPSMWIAMVDRLTRLGPNRAIGMNG
jgi:hypothetical protein